jgi:2-methylcitrate dehydratase PrpD
MGEATVDRVKLLFLDHLATLLFSTRAAQYPRARALLPLFGQGDVPLVGGGGSSLLGAAYFHGLLATSDDFDDSHRYVGGLHLAASIFPALLALSATTQMSGRDFIEAACRGYEVASKVGRAVDAGLRQRMWHATGVVGPLGAAAAAARALNLSGEDGRNAIGIAASSSGGLFAFLTNNATVRHVHGANAASDGLLAAVAAKSGMTGPKDLFRRSGGFFGSFVDQADFSALAALGGPIKRPEVLDTYVKLFPCCGHAYPSITAAMHYLDTRGRIDDISGIRFEVYKASSLLGTTTPRTNEALKFSIPGLIAIVLSVGRLGYPEINMDTLENHVDPGLPSKISVVEDLALSAQFPAKRAARMIVETTGGDRIEIYSDSPIGMPENPPRWSQIKTKFVEAAAHGGIEVNAGQVISRVSTLETLGSMSEIAAMLA